MKIIIDTNILVSAAIADEKPEAVIYTIINRSDFDWIVSEEILTEYRTVLNRPKLKLNEQKRIEWLTLIEKTTQKIELSVTVDFARDSKDAKFIACAIAAEDDFLITGDKDFEEVLSMGQTVVISVSDFKKTLSDIDVEDKS